MPDWPFARGCFILVCSKKCPESADREADDPPVLTKPSSPNVMSSAPEQAPAPARHLQVPRTDGAWLQRPSASVAAELVRSNRQALAGVELDIQGCSLSRLRAWTRETVSQAAMTYTGSWATQTSQPATTGSWIVGGHQPALFHPGVWAKNFAMGRLARQLSGVSLNLVVDNDTLASQSIKVPVGTVADPRTIQVPFDSTQSQQPWEDVTVQDPSLFKSFADRVSQNLRGWNYSPLINEFWPDVIAGTSMTGRVADGFTSARNRWERKWGLENLELPLSRLCQLPPFLWFVTHLLVHLPRFWSIYNESVRDYRRQNGIHGTSHPVPELTQIGDWQEAPFWVWRAGDRRRSRLFARQRNGSIELAVDGKESLGELPLTPETDAQRAVTRLQELQSAGLHLRTRALTTTLFSRVCLADLFVHGIGGAKYDEITDRLIAEFWGLPVPTYWTVSGTLQLPLGCHPATTTDLEGCQRSLWDLRWNPTRALADLQTPEVRRLCEEFHQILNHPALDMATRRTRHVELSRIKTALRPWTREHLQSAQARMIEISQQLAANRVLQDREYSYVLYPTDKLRRFLTTEPGERGA